MRAGSENLKKIRIWFFSAFYLILLAACQANNLDADLIGTWRAVPTGNIDAYLTFLGNGQGFRTDCAAFEGYDCAEMGHLYFRWEALEGTVYLTHYFLHPQLEKFEYEIINNELHTHYFLPMERMDFSWEPTLDLDALD